MQIMTGTVKKNTVSKMLDTAKDVCCSMHYTYGQEEKMCHICVTSLQSSSTHKQSAQKFRLFHATVTVNEIENGTKV